MDWSSRTPTSIRHLDGAHCACGLRTSSIAPTRKITPSALPTPARLPSAHRSPIATKSIAGRARRSTHGTRRIAIAGSAVVDGPNLHNLWFFACLLPPEKEYGCAHDPFKLREEVFRIGCISL